MNFKKLGILSLLLSISTFATGQKSTSFGLISGYKLTHWAGIIGGIELVNRTYKVEGVAGVTGLNGRKTEGLYWQGILGLRFYYKDLLSVDARATLPVFLLSPELMMVFLPTKGRLLNACRFLGLWWVYRCFEFGKISYPKSFKKKLRFFKVIPLLIRLPI